MKSEPLVTVASLTAIVAAVLGLVISFGLPVDKDQQSAILGLVAVVSPLAVAALARHRVTPVPATDDTGAVNGSIVVTLAAVLVAIAALIYILGHVELHG